MSVSIADPSVSEVYPCHLQGDAAKIVMLLQAREDSKVRCDAVSV